MTPVCAGNDSGFSSSSYAFAPVVGSGCCLLSTNTTVVASPQHQAGTMFHVLFRMATRVVLWTKRRSTLPDGLVYSREVLCFGGPAQLSRPDSSHRMVPFF